MLYRYDAFNIRGIILLIKRSSLYNLRTSSDSLQDLIDSDDQINEDIAENDDLMDLADINELKSKEANTYNMYEISYLKNLIEFSIDISNMNTTDIVAIALAKHVLDSNQDIQYLGVINEDNALFNKNPIIIG